ncbi:MAG: pentapeptide repeat-containing protein [Gammaproteobacteria bacterium]
MSTFWYTKRESIVRGPYPAGQISRYILLGRIKTTDELSTNKEDWAPVFDCPEVIPDVMNLDSTDENLEHLILTKMYEDERKPGDRRDRTPQPPAHILERRSGHERRKTESDLVLRHRKNKSRLNLKLPGAETSLSGLVVFSLMIFSILLLVQINKQDSGQASPDCYAAPTAGVNWDNCNLASSRLNGANLQYALIRNARLDGSELSGVWLANSRLDYSNLNISDLKKSDLSFAVITGASFNGADLSHANLQGADLSYANLAGAVIENTNFEGAILNQAIWVDRRICAPGSIGECL